MSALLAWFVCTIVAVRGLFVASSRAFARRGRSGGPLPSPKVRVRRRVHASPRPRPPGLDDAWAEAPPGPGVRDPGPSRPRRKPWRRGPLVPREDPGRSP